MERLYEACKWEKRQTLSTPAAEPLAQEFLDGSPIFFMGRAYFVLAGSIFKLYTPSTRSSSTKSLNKTLNIFMTSITRTSNTMSTLLLSHCWFSLSLWHLPVYPPLWKYIVLCGCALTSVPFLPSDLFPFGTVHDKQPATCRYRYSAWFPCLQSGCLHLMPTFFALGGETIMLIYRLWAKVICGPTSALSGDFSAIFFSSFLLGKFSPTPESWLEIN